jgi:hypothetical protein
MSESGIVVKKYPDVKPVEGQPLLGRNVHHDPESRRYAFKAAPITAPLVSVEHRIELEILNQGDIGSCVPNMGTSFLAWWKIKSTLPEHVQNNLNEAFAVQWYREVTRIDPFKGEWEPDDTGSDGLSCAKVAKSRGHISGYVHTFDPVSALVALQDSPIGIGIAWREGCYYPNADGLISYTGDELGGHEILAVGFNAEKQWVKLRNSWGHGWGKDGHFYMTVVDFTRALRDQGDAIIFVPNNQPAPEPDPLPDVEPNDKPTPADRALMAKMNPWSDGIISKLTKAGKASEAYRVWKNVKGL